MSKQIKKTTPAKSGAGFLADLDLGKFIPEKFKTPAAILAIVVLMFAFYSPVMFGDKTVQGTDYMQMKSMRTYIEKSHEGFSLWNPYLFCGMPAYATSTEMRWFDFTAVAYSIAARLYSAVFSDAHAIYTFSFLLMAITAFMFMRSRGAGRGVSFLVAAAMIFSTGLSMLYFIGHVTKLMSLALLPFILMMLLKFQKKITLLDFFLLTLGMHLLVLGAHVQIVFYLVLLTLVYYIFYFVYAAVKKDKFLTKQTAKSLGVMGAASLIALFMSFDTYAQLYEYKPYSTRGTKSAVEAAMGQQQAQTDSYEYNTSWSFSPGEVMTFLVPSYYGFGKSTYNGPISQLDGQEVSTYFGQMPFVDTAMYMGILVFILGLFALFVMWKDPFIKFSAIIIVLFILISFGKNFPLVFDFMYYNFPMFNNFRVPSMILHVLQVLFPILAGLAVLKLIELKKEGNLKIANVVRILAFIFTGLLFLSFIFGSALKNGIIQRIAESPYIQENTRNYFNALSDYIASMFLTDINIGMLLAAAMFWVIYLFLTNKLSKSVLVAGLTLLVLIDLFRVSSRGTTFTSAEEFKSLFREPDYVRIIKEQKDTEPFRIANFKQDRSLGSVYQSYNYHVNFLLEDIYGYSAVKPRAYEDIMSVVGPQNPVFWRMTGTKYIIINTPVEQPGLTLVKNEGQTHVYRNEGALPRAFLVDSVAAKSGVEILDAMVKMEFDPKSVAFVEDASLKVDKPGKDSSVKIVKYSDAKLELEVNATGNNFLFFSTNYIPAGWKAYIDGAGTKIHKANHAFMGIAVPAGKHKVEFEYLPSSFTAGKYISMLLNILLFGGIIFAAVRLRKKEQPEGND